MRVRCAWKSLLLALLLVPALPLALPLAGTAARAQGMSAGQLDAVLSRGTLRVGMPGDFRPFGLKGNDGKYEGLDVDMAEALAKVLGVTLEIVPTAWGQLMPDLKAGKFDIGMGGISVTLERQKQAMFSTPLLRTGKTPIARCTDQARYQTIADIDKPEVRLIVNPGGTNERFARANMPHAALTVFPNNAAIFDELVAGRGDVMVTDGVEARLQQKLHPELCAINPDKPFDFGEIGYLLPRDPVWKSYVDQWLHVAAETGDLKHAMAKWIP